MPSSKPRSRSRKPPTAQPEYAPPDDLRLPDADRLFSPVTVNPSDLDSITVNSVFRHFVREVHVRQYQLQGGAVRAADATKLAEIRGASQELDRILSVLHSYTTGTFGSQPDDDKDDEDGFDDILAVPTGLLGN